MIKKIQTQLIKEPQCLESVDSESDNEEQEPVKKIKCAGSAKEKDQSLQSL